jgi:hypothetical protein
MIHGVEEKHIYSNFKNLRSELDYNLDFGQTPSFRGSHQVDDETKNPKPLDNTLPHISDNFMDLKWKYLFCGHLRQYN